MSAARSRPDARGTQGTRGTRAGRLAAAIVAAAIGTAAAAPPASPAPSPPVVAIDEGHANHHTAGGRYAPFAALLGDAGFRVVAARGALSRRGLAGVRVLVIANALHPANRDAWRRPVLPAFTAAEIAEIRRWVHDGGGLLLVADHFPFPAAVGSLASAFGYRFADAYALSGSPGGVDVFDRDAGTLRAHPVTDGTDDADRVRSVATFTGSAFRAPPEAAPLLVLGPAFQLLLPDAAWEFAEGTPRLPGAGWLQAAVSHHGRGRVAVFAEAAMLTSQRAQDDPARAVGFDAPEAADNRRLAVNVVRWLAGGR